MAAIHPYELGFKFTEKDGFENEYGGFFDTAWDAIQAASCLEWALPLYGERMLGDELDKNLKTLEETGHVTNKSGRWTITKKGE